MELTEQVRQIQGEYHDLFRQYAIARQAGVRYQVITGYMQRVEHLREDVAELLKAAQGNDYRLLENIAQGTGLILLAE